MTKEEWLITRDNKEIPMDVWFSFYKEKGGIANKNLFEQIFVNAIFHEAVFLQVGKKVTFGSCLRNLFKHYNTKFEV